MNNQNFLKEKKILLGEKLSGTTESSCTLLLFISGNIIRRNYIVFYRLAKHEVIGY